MNSPVSGRLAPGGNAEMCTNTRAFPWSGATNPNPRLSSHSVILPLNCIQLSGRTVDAGERQHETIKSTKLVEKQAIEPRVQRIVMRRVPRRIQRWMPETE